MGKLCPCPCDTWKGRGGRRKRGGRTATGEGGQRDERRPAGINKGTTPVKGGTQQSNRNSKSQRDQRTAGINASRSWVDTPTPANKRWCRKERHWEEEEVTDAMATTEEDAVAVALAMTMSFSSSLNSIHSNSYFLDYRTIQIETSQIECFLDLVISQKKCALPTSQVKGNL